MQWSFPRPPGYVFQALADMRHDIRRNVAEGGEVPQMLKALQHDSQTQTEV
jgi:hypothetical protein